MTHDGWLQVRLTSRVASPDIKMSSPAADAYEESYCSKYCYGGYEYEITPTAYRSRNLLESEVCLLYCGGQPPLPPFPFVNVTFEGYRKDVIDKKPSFDNSSRATDMIDLGGEKSKTLRSIANSSTVNVIYSA
ncbi:hypothetical protein V8E51_007424 [Hyaloscypha variabilis]